VAAVSAVDVHCFHPQSARCAGKVGNRVTHDGNMTKDYQRLPKFEFPPVPHPNSLPKLYLFFTQIKFRSQRFGKTGRFPVIFPVLRTAKP
jgi:hypothetical protein